VWAASQVADEHVTMAVWDGSLASADDSGTTRRRVTTRAPTGTPRTRGERDAVAWHKARRSPTDLAAGACPSPS
jgi:hypothetical protein